MAKVRICGHRGMAARAPENTLAGITLARRRGVGQVEVDLRLTRDGRVVVHHDADLGRTAPGRGKIRDRDFADLAGLDAGSWFSAEFADQRIPSLEDLLAAGGETLEWNLELKTDDPGDPAAGRLLVTRVLAGIAGAGMFRRVLLTSFDHGLIRTALGMKGAPRCGFIYGKKGPLETDHGDPVAVFSLRHKLITPDLVRRAHEENREVHAWTVNEERTLARMIDLGVDVVISDDPGRMLDLI